MPGVWFGPPFDPAAIAKCQGERRRDDLLAIANTRLGMVSKHLTAVERMHGEQPLACQGGHLSVANPLLAAAKRELKRRKHKMLQRGGIDASPEAAGGKGSRRKKARRSR
jgi:hypothetical protein